MAKLVLFDEIHLSFQVPASLPPDKAQSIRRLLGSQSFHSRLRRSVSALLRRYRSMQPLRLVISR